RNSCRWPTRVVRGNRARASVWPSAAISWPTTAGASGWKASPAKARRFHLPCRVRPTTLARPLRPRKREAKRAWCSSGSEIARDHVFDLRGKARRASVLRFEHVAAAVNRAQRYAAAGDLLAQAMDVDLDRVEADVAFIAVNLLEQALLADDLPKVHEQRFQQAHLAGR